MPSVLAMLDLHQKGRQLHNDASEQHCSPRANATLPQNSDAALSRDVDVPEQDSCCRPITTLWQEHWLTPTATAWQQTERLVAQVAALLDWMHSPVQKPKMQQQHAQELWETLMMLLTTLVLGHIMDMSLDMRIVFCASFSAVIQGWALTQGLSSHTDFELDDNCFGDTMFVTPTARALLRRLGTDDLLWVSLCCSSSGYVIHNVY